MMIESLFDKQSTGLVVIDLQKGIVGMTTEPYPAKSVVANAAQLARAFRKNNMPVFLLRVTPSPDGKDGLRPHADTPPPNIQRDTDWADIVPELGPEPGDFVITKRQWGAFYGTELDLQLRRRRPGAHCAHGLHLRPRGRRDRHWMSRTGTSRGGAGG